MKGRTKLVYILITTIILGCSSDNSNDAEKQDLNRNLLKSGKMEKEDYEEFYKYDYGFLVEKTAHWSADGINLHYKYNYDAEGKLIKQVYNSQSYSYVYDTQKRLIKEIVDGSNDYTLLEYTTNKVTVTNYFEKRFNVPKTFVTEFYTDPSGRILKAVRTKGLQGADGNEFSPSTEYIYDAKGNIIKKTDNNNDGTNTISVVEYEYDDKNNPYYYSYKKLNQSLYYLIYVGTASLLEDYCPNNKVAIKYYGLTYAKDKLLYNTENFPIKKVRYIYDDAVNLSSESEVIFDYY